MQKQKHMKMFGNAALVYNVIISQQAKNTVVTSNLTLVYHKKGLISQSHQIKCKSSRVRTVKSTVS